MIDVQLTKENDAYVVRIFGMGSPITKSFETVVEALDEMAKEFKREAMRCEGINRIRGINR